jgi:putative endonuclease
VASDLSRRTYEHKTGVVPGLARRYKVHMLVWFEIVPDIMAAIRREKTIKVWP